MFFSAWRIESKQFETTGTEPVLSSVFNCDAISVTSLRIEGIGERVRVMRSSKSARKAGSVIVVVELGEEEIE